MSKRKYNIIKIYSVIHLWLACTGVCLSAEKENVSDIDPGYVVFDNADSDIPYRIPAMAENRRGDIIAVADYRHSKQDIGMSENGRVDLRYRIKDWESGEWGDILILKEAEGEGDDNIAFGDPCIVADRESDRILLTSCCGNVSFPKGTHENHQGWARFYSEDGGKSWSDYKDISCQVFEILDKLQDGEIRCFFIAAGKIAQSERIKAGDYYRLYCSALVKLSDGSNVNYVLYSDDFGDTWQLLGDVDVPAIPAGADEAKVVELPDGNVLISSRIPGGRWFNVFHYTSPSDGLGEWDEPLVSKAEKGGVVASGNACNGEILLISEPSTDRYLLLQSVPLGPEGRNNVGINYKWLNKPEDYAGSEAISKEWHGRIAVSDTTSAYSTMLLNKSGTLSFLYEENAGNGGYDIVYKEIQLNIFVK